MATQGRGVELDRGTGVSLLQIWISPSPTCARILVVPVETGTFSTEQSDPPKMGKGTAKMNLLLVDQKLLETEDKVLFLLCPLHCVIPGRCVINVLAKLNGWDGS